MATNRYQVFLRTTGKTAYDSCVQKTTTVQARSETEAVSIAQAQNPGFTAYNVKQY